MSDSVQHKLSRVRPPRVQITYDVEIGNAILMKELPFVVGIMADLSGKPEEALPKVRDRKFVEIDRDNFNDILSSINPRIAYRVPNRLTEGDEDSEAGDMLNVELKFSHIDDFEPVAVINQVNPLRQLFEARQRLSDLLTKLDGNDELDALLQDVIANSESQDELKKSLDSGDGGDAGGDAGGDKGKGKGKGKK